ncbi:hypothetical protein K0A97_00230 [Patescibacteria group bacterium]|nr:hypothetical protein [Patescibacteria group bacterium]
MKVKNTLTGIVLAGALALGVGGCTANPDYNFEGKIGEEQVKFFERNGCDCSFFLEVLKPNGNKIKYAFDENSNLDYFQITVGDSTTKYSAYSPNPVVTGMVRKAQKELDFYLTRIIDLEAAPLNERYCDSLRDSLE